MMFIGVSMIVAGCLIRVTDYLFEFVESMNSADNARSGNENG
jgi:hypothetical protein